ncbi:uncharacterized protein BXZ73DRAFT_100851 [Epithele typhae]|uniref:uncharacterized protein n=1 Tax=Epithele typhae TaxID=378194 RepID=UPI0020088722|nr:uncharacterized protein BXZ73DRAFT_100851 [Epithele typhae]KAH9934012.1 hypothetical protein BXZ73DRAFT_100851 [Epithele typhae]
MLRPPPLSGVLAWGTLLLLVAANILIDVAHVRATKRTAALRAPPASRYSFIDEDFPLYLPIPSLPNRRVALALEESAHYHSAAAGVAGQLADQEWRYVGGGGDGNVRLGPSRRFFNTGFSYEVHCARVLASAFQNPAPMGERRRGEVEHVKRCLNVVRQFALCGADAGLEPAWVVGAPGVRDGPGLHAGLGARNLSVERWGGEKRCRDFPGMYEAMDANWAEWRGYQKSL